MSTAATADLSWAKTPDETAAAWSVFVIRELIRRREEGISSVAASVFPFSRSAEGIVTLPAGAMPIGHPPSPELATFHLENTQDLYAYLVVITGEPGVPGEWAGPSFTDAQRAAIPIGVPRDLCEEGDYDFYLIAALVCGSYPVTWACRFDGEKFGELKYAQDTYGGSLLGLLGIGEN